jgi:agmatinase
MFIVKVPGVNNPGNIQGCRNSGNAVLRALKKEIMFNESGREVDFDKIELEEIHLDNSHLQLDNKLIYENAFKIFESKPKTIFLGGDHSITYSLGRAFLDYCENSVPSKEPCLIVFDAFPDLKYPAKMKEPNSESWLRALIDEGFSGKNILLIGNQGFSRESGVFVKEHKIRVISLNQFLLDIEDTCDALTEFSNGKELYVSIDSNVIDPAFAPAVCSKKGIGGFTSRQFLYLLQRINLIKNLRGIDLVEIDSEKDREFNNITVRLGAKILGEIL